MKAKVHALGDVNPCGLASLCDKKGNLVLNCLDTPNAIAFAFKHYPKCFRVVGAFGVPEQFGVKKEFKKDYLSRFNSGLTEVECGIRLAGSTKNTVNTAPKKTKSRSKKEATKAVLSSVLGEEVISAYYSKIV